MTKTRIRSIALATFACAAFALSLCSCGGRSAVSDDIRDGDLLTGLMRPMNDFRAARVSSYDRSGGNADALSGIEPGQTAVLADIEGPGMITHIWFTIAAEKYHGRTLVLRAYWDDEPDPSILTPVNDFFCMGHGMEAALWSLPIVTTATGRARNCFFKMPFNKRARIEIVNEGIETVGAFYYYIDYRVCEKPFRDPLYFHARYRQEYPAIAGRDYLICSAAGRGQFVGMNYSVESHHEGWWGEGDDRFYIDGEKTPSIQGTGSEDYLCDAWGMWPGSSPFYGTPIHEGSPYTYPNATRYTSYRFHIADPIPFRESLRFAIEHYGVGPKNGGLDGFVERADNLSSVAYWYQSEPHAPMDSLPPAAERLPDEARKEKKLLGFFRDSSAPSQTPQSLESVRVQYNDLAADPEMAGRVADLRVRMARAELTAGHLDRAKAALGDALAPFIHRSALEVLRPVADRLDVKVTPLTPLLVPWEDGASAVRVLDGKPCVATDEKARKEHIYFALPDNSPLRGLDRTVAIRVTYYSEGRSDDTFAIQYDSFYSDDIEGKYRLTDRVKKPTLRGWHTAVIECPRARFQGGQNGKSDFRLTDLGDGEEAFAAVEVVEPAR